MHMQQQVQSGLPNLRKVVTKQQYRNYTLTKGEILLTADLTVLCGEGIGGNKDIRASQSISHLCLCSVFALLMSFMLLSWTVSGKSSSVRVYLFTKGLVCLWWVQQLHTPQYYIMHMHIDVSFHDLFLCVFYLLLADASFRVWTYDSVSFPGCVIPEKRENSVNKLSTQHYSCLTLALDVHHVKTHSASFLLNSWTWRWPHKY